MKTIIKLSIIAFLAIFATSCATQKRCEKLYPAQTKVKDSVVVSYKDSVIYKTETKTVIKDSIVYTPALVDSGEIDIKPSKRESFRFKNDKVSVIITIDSNKIKWNVNISAIENRFMSKIDSLNKVIEVYKEKDSLKVSEKESIRVVEKEEKKLGFFGKIHKVLNDYALRILLFLVGFLILRRIIIRNFGNIL